MKHTHACLILPATALVFAMACGNNDSGFDAGVGDDGGAQIFDTGASDAPVPVPMTRFLVAGDDAAHGIFDFSITYDSNGVGWMAYSGLETPIGTISLRLARSDDKGASWTFVQVLNAASNDTVDVGGVPTAGQWRHEISTIVNDPMDPNPSRRWKLYWHEYFYDGVDSHYLTHGWLAARYAPAPTGPWSAREILFGPPLIESQFSPTLELNTLAPSTLSDCLFHIEPGAMVYDNDLYFAFWCLTSANHEEFRTELIKSENHGDTWSFVGEMTSSADALPFSALNFTAPSLGTYQGDPILIITPQRTGPGLGGVEVVSSYAGCMAVRFADLNAATLERNGSGELQPLATLEGDETLFRGACGYHEENTGGGIVMSQFNLDAPIFFQGWNTHRLVQ
jgi:hypothetical protein